MRSQGRFDTATTSIGDWGLWPCDDMHLVEGWDSTEVLQVDSIACFRVIETRLVDCQIRSRVSDMLARLVALANVLRDRIRLDEVKCWSCSGRCIAESLADTFTSELFVWVALSRKEVILLDKCTCFLVCHGFECSVLGLLLPLWFDVHIALVLPLRICCRTLRFSACAPASWHELGTVPIATECFITSRILGCSLPSEWLDHICMPPAYANRSTSQSVSWRACVLMSAARTHTHLTVTLLLLPLLIVDYKLGELPCLDMRHPSEVFSAQVGDDICHDWRAHWVLTRAHWHALSVDDRERVVVFCCESMVLQSGRFLLDVLDVSDRFCVHVFAALEFLNFLWC